MMRKAHQFDNGVKVYDDQLLEVQRERYQSCNVHEEDEEEVFVSCIRGLPGGAVYVNVGTAVGYYPLLARSLRDDLRVHCFEPLPRHLKYLRENIALNGYREEWFHIHPLAVSTEAGKARFVDNSYGSSLSSGSGSPGKKDKSGVRIAKEALLGLMGNAVRGREITVSSISLAGIFEEIGSDTVDFLQMDIQGFEEPVLASYFSEQNRGRGTIQRILVGTHGKGIHLKCRSHLEGAGYRIVHDEQDTQHQPDGILLAELGNGRQA